MILHTAKIVKIDGHFNISFYQGHRKTLHYVFKSRQKLNDILRQSGTVKVGKRGGGIAWAKLDDCRQITIIINEPQRWFWGDGIYE